MRRSSTYGHHILVFDEFACMSKRECTTIELEEGWGLMEERIMKLKNSLEEGSMLQLSTEECMMLYTTVYTMCTQEPPNDFSKQLYGKYRESLEDYMTSLVLPILQEKHGEFMLKELVKRWENHKTMVRWFFGFLHYLDRYYIPENSLLPLNEVGLTCFCDLVLKKLNGKVIEAGIALINQDRGGGQIDQALIKTVLDIFVQNGMDRYKNDFEVALLKDTSAYYSEKASKWFQEFPCPSYMLKVEECLKWEKDRVAHYLHSSNESKLLENVEHELLSVYAKQLCHALLRDDKVEDLSRMFRLFSKIPKDLDPVYSTFEQHVTEKGTALVKLAEDAASNKRDFVPKVIELHEKYLAYINDFILNHTPFDKALKDAFEIFCNKVVSGSSSAELLATFCDNILKKGESKELSVEAIEQIFEKVVRLLARISDKDMFAEFHRKKMARRLLINKGANDVYEKSFLAKLKQQNGQQFTSMMERMIKDLMLAKEKYRSFEEYLSGNPNADLGIHLTVTVLNRATWPSYESVDLNLPAEMAKCVAVYKEFFESKRYKGKLTWIYSLGTCKMIGRFERKTMKLNVTPYQASALLLFNSSDRLSYSEIRKQLNLSDDDVKRVLHSLSCANYTILTKEPDTKAILSTDYFEFNSKFTHKMSKIQIPLPSVEKKKVIDVVDKDRKYALEASIVRIMKSRKTLNFHLLVAECVQQLQSTFKPDVRAIKKRIEDLISREYLKRDNDDSALIKYMA